MVRNTRTALWALALGVLATAAIAAPAPLDTDRTLASDVLFPTERVAPIASPSMATVEAVGLPFSGSSTTSLFVRTVRKVGGSGFVVGAEGYVIAGPDTVRDAEYVYVTIEGVKYKAKEVANDEFYELSLLKIDDPKARGVRFKPVKWGSSSAMQVGEPLVVIGSPANLDKTITYGFVTNIRDVRLRGPQGLSTGVLVPGALETDAAIVPANYGGPVFNAQGEAVAVVNRYTGPESGQQNMNYAIPSDVLKPIIDQLISKGRAFHPWFGVEPYVPYYQDNGNLATYLGVPTRAINPDTGEAYGVVGVLVGRVSELSPASEAGIKRGDLLLKFNGVLLRDTKSLELAILGLKFGESFTLTIVRAGAVQNKRIPIADRPTTKDQQDRDIRIYRYGI